LLVILAILGGGDQEDLYSRPDQAKHREITSQSIKLGVVASTCHPSYARSINRRLMVQACFKNN
jgi:hypothetical protein